MLGLTRAITTCSWLQGGRDVRLKSLLFFPWFDRFHQGPAVITGRTAIPLLVDRPLPGSLSMETWSARAYCREKNKRRTRGKMRFKRRATIVRLRRGVGADPTEKQLRLCLSGISRRGTLAAIRSGICAARAMRMAPSGPFSAVSRPSKARCEPRSYDA
jgi:hypothetical protein